MTISSLRRLDFTATTSASTARSAADLEISAACAICSMRSALFTRPSPGENSMSRNGARLIVALRRHRRGLVVLGQRLGLALERDLQNLVDPFHRDDLELVLDVVRDVDEVLH